MNATHQELSQEKAIYQALLKFRFHCARIAENYEEPHFGPKILGGLLQPIRKPSAPARIADLIRGIDITSFSKNEPPPLKRNDRVLVNETAGFSRGSKGTVQYVTPNGEIWVCRDGSNSDMFFHRNELDLIQS